MLNFLKKLFAKKLVIKIKYFHPIAKIAQIEKGNWIDLKSTINIKYVAGDRIMIPLGVAMKLPEGYEAHLAPRSGTFKKYGLIETNSVGVIDNSFSGNGDQWHMPCYALTDGYISKGDRICQFRIMEIMPEVEIEEVCELEDEDRGGFGSTGK